MALKNWIIDLRVDVDNNEQADIILQEVRTKAKELLTLTQLLGTSRKPDIAIHNDDMYEGREQIEMFTPEEKEEYGL